MHPKMHVKTRFRAVYLSVCLVLLQCPLAHADYIYVTDKGAGTVMKYDANGSGYTFASGLNDPRGLAFDTSGNLFVASAGDGTITKFDPVGNSAPFYSGLSSPTGLAFDSFGNLFVAEAGIDTISKFDSEGTRSVFATNVLWLQHLTFDNGGNLYVSSIHDLLKFDSMGDRSTFLQFLGYPNGLRVNDAGDFYYCYADDYNIIGIPADGSPSWLAWPFGGHYPAGFVSLDLDFGSNGDLYVAGAGKIWEIDSGGNASVFASGLSGAEFIAVQAVPEPGTWTLLVTGVAVLFGSLRYCCVARVTRQREP